MVESVLRYAKYCQSWVQSKFSRQLSTGREIAKTNVELQEANAELRARVRDLQGRVRSLRQRRDRLQRQLVALRGTRAVRFSHWLAERPWLRWPLKAAFDLAGGARRLVLGLLGLRREEAQPPAAPPPEKAPDPAGGPPETAERDEGWRGERGY
jgi:hypothetical protein